MKKVVLSAMIIGLCLANSLMAQASLKDLFKGSVSEILPTATERNEILNKLKTNGQIDKTPQNTWEWHLIDTYPLHFTSQGLTRKVYIDTLNSQKPYKNLVRAYVKELNSDGNYSIIQYRFFCNQGYMGIDEVKNYNANGQKISRPFSVKADIHDTPVKNQDVIIGKNACAINGFYQGMPKS